MAGAVGLFSVAVGAIAAWAAKRFPGHDEALETGAGLLLICGFALAGVALPAMV